MSRSGMRGPLGRSSSAWSPLDEDLLDAPDREGLDLLIGQTPSFINRPANWAMRSSQNIASAPANLALADRTRNPMSVLSVLNAANPFNPQNAFSANPDVDTPHWQYNPDLLGEDVTGNFWSGLAFDVLADPTNIPSLALMSRLRGLSPSIKPLTKEARNTDVLGQMERTRGGNIFHEYGETVYQLADSDLTLSVVASEAHPDELYVAFMGSPKEREGANTMRGFEAMMDFLSEADRGGVTIRMFPSASGRVKQDSLENMYKSMGFVDDPSNRPYMVRRPNPAMGALYDQGLTGREAFAFERTPGFSQLDPNDQLSLMTAYTMGPQQGLSADDIGNMFKQAGLPDKEAKRFSRMYEQNMGRQPRPTPESAYSQADAALQSLARMMQDEMGLGVDESYRMAEDFLASRPNATLEDVQRWLGGQGALNADMRQRGRWLEVLEQEFQERGFDAEYARSAASSYLDDYLRTHPNATPDDVEGAVRGLLGEPSPSPNSGGSPVIAGNVTDLDIHIRQYMDANPEAAPFVDSWLEGLQQRIEQMGFSPREAAQIAPDYLDDYLRQHPNADPSAVAFYVAGFGMGNPSARQGVIRELLGRGYDQEEAEQMVSLLFGRNRNPSQAQIERWLEGVGSAWDFR